MVELREPREFFCNFFCFHSDHCNHHQLTAISFAWIWCQKLFSLHKNFLIHSNSSSSSDNGGVWNCFFLLLQVSSQLWNYFIKAKVKLTHTNSQLLAWNRTTMKEQKNIEICFWVEVEIRKRKISFFSHSDSRSFYHMLSSWLFYNCSDFVYMEKHFSSLRL